MGDSEGEGSWTYFQLTDKEFFSGIENEQYLMTFTMGSGIKLLNGKYVFFSSIHKNLDLFSRLNKMRKIVTKERISHFKASVSIFKNQAWQTYYFCQSYTTRVCK